MEKGSRKRRGMALNISLRGYRRNVGRPIRGIIPGFDDGVSDFAEGDGTPENHSERRFPVARRGLRAVDENRAVLEEGVASPHLCRPHEFTAMYEDLAADGGRKTGGRPDRRPNGRSNSEDRIDSQGPQRDREPRVNFPVRLTQRTKRLDRRGDRVGEFVFMPNGLTARRPTDNGDAVRDAVQRLIPAN